MFSHVILSMALVLLFSDIAGSTLQQGNFRLRERMCTSCLQLSPQDSLPCLLTFHSYCRTCSKVRNTASKQVHVQTYMYTLYTCTLYMFQKGCHFTDAVFEEWPPSLLTLGSMSSSVTNSTSRSLSVALSDALLFLCTELEPSPITLPFSVHV